MSSGVRTKSKKKQTGKKLVQRGRRIQVEDLRLGDRIVTSWHGSETSAKQAAGQELTMDEVMDVLRDGESSARFVNTSVEIKQFDECPGMWRTHVHINRSDCYDMRGYVWIVDVDAQ